nr:2-C-methyl-D-erythritol 4-phosphate cytidylyltransferase [Synergistaceae bacterium]
MATFSFLLMAAGKGSRMGGVPKQFRFLAGVPVWLWSVRIAELLYHKKMIFELIIVTSSDVT